MTTVLLVAGDAALPDFEVLKAADRASVMKLLDERTVDAVVARMKLPDGTSGLALVRELAERHPEPRRILLAAYEDLPEIVRVRGLVARVLPHTADGPRIARAIREALAPQEESSISKSTAEAMPQLEELLRWSAARLAQVKGVVVRPLPREMQGLQMQFVLPEGKRVEWLRNDVVKQWLWPVKPRDGKVARKDRKHPVVQMLGGLSPRSEVYAKQAKGATAYLVLLPWQREKRLTAVLGLITDKPRPDLWPVLKEVHRQAVEGLAEFALPQIEEASGIGHAIPEYDWIVTADYAGVDRRRRPTSFLNRFVLFGRRRRVPSRIAHVSEAFTDVPRPKVQLYFVAYVVLAVIDTALTWHCVRSGMVREANPLLRPLVLHHPWLFLVVKNAVALAAFFAVARFELFRFGMWAVRAAVLGYLLLDVYWAVLLRLWS